MICAGLITIVGHIPAFIDNCKALIKVERISSPDILDTVAFMIHFKNMIFAECHDRIPLRRILQRPFSNKGIVPPHKHIGRCTSGKNYYRQNYSEKIFHFYPTPFPVPPEADFLDQQYSSQHIESGEFSAPSA